MYKDPAGNTAFSHSVLSSSLTSLNTEGEMRERPAIVGPQNCKETKKELVYTLGEFLGVVYIIIILARWLNIWTIKTTVPLANKWNYQFEDMTYETIQADLIIIHKHCRTTIRAVPATSWKFLNWPGLNNIKHWHVKQVQNHYVSKNLLSRRCF